MNNKEQPFHAFFVKYLPQAQQRSSNGCNCKPVQFQSYWCHSLLCSKDLKKTHHEQNRVHLFFFKMKILQEVLLAPHLFLPSGLNPARTHKSHLPTETHNVTNNINDRKADSFSNYSTRRCSVLLPVADCV